MSYYSVGSVFIEGRSTKDAKKEDIKFLLDQAHKTEYFKKLQYSDNELDNMHKFVRTCSDPLWVVKVWQSIVETSIVIAEAMSNKPEDIKKTLVYKFHMHDNMSIRKDICEALKKTKDRNVCV